MACSWYDPDEEYYNLFDQHLLSDKSLSPFLLTYGQVNITINLIKMVIKKWKK
jgi:hypothetical protein